MIGASKATPLRNLKITVQEQNKFSSPSGMGHSSPHLFSISFAWNGAEAMDWIEAGKTMKDFAAVLRRMAQEFEEIPD